MNKAVKDLFNFVFGIICTFYACVGLTAMYRNNELPFQNHDKTTNVIINKQNPDKDKLDTKELLKQFAEFRQAQNKDKNN